jgi:predicted O-methyltransferase YrrM
LLFQVLRRDPRQFLERLLTFAESQADRFSRRAQRAPAPWNIVIQQLDQYLGGELEVFLREDSLREIEERVAEGQSQLLRQPAFDILHNADLSLARLSYAICRLRQPEVVVETGVGYGVTTAFLLQALAVNHKGGLWSIDLPPLAEGAETQTGWLVPAALRARWHLLRGSTRRLLPKLVSDVPTIDVFLHDSLHTFWNMSREFQTVWPNLAAGGVLISDDVERNRAFEVFARSRDVSLAVSAGEEDKASVFGVMVKAGPPPRSS